MSVKSKTKFGRKRLSKSRYTDYHVSSASAFCEKGKSLVKISVIKREDLSISCLFKESASILEQATRSYGGLKSVKTK